MFALWNAVAECKAMHLGPASNPFTRDAATKQANTFWSDETKSDLNGGAPDFKWDLEA